MIAKKAYCEHCGSYEGPLVYKRELGAYYCPGHAPVPETSGKALYTPVEKPYRIVKHRADGFIYEIIDSDTPYLSEDDNSDSIFVDHYTCSTLLAEKSNNKKLI